MIERMNCAEVEELLSAYLDNELSQGLDDAVELHLDTCRSCTTSLIEIKKISNIIRNSELNIIKNIDDKVLAENFDVILDNIEDCRFVEDNLHYYIDGELEEDSENLIKNHLKICKYCRYDYENLLALKNNIKNYFDSNVENILREKEFDNIIKKLSRAKFRDYMIISMASTFAVSMFVWFTLKSVHPEISKTSDVKTLQQISLKYKHEDVKKNKKSDIQEDIQMD